MDFIGLALGQVWNTLIRFGVVLYLAVVLSLPSAILADFQCLCNHHTSRTVYSTITGSSLPLGYLYQDECKEFLQKSSDNRWAAVAFAHELGFVKLDHLTTITVCTGDPSVNDKLTTSAPTQQPTYTASPPQTKTTTGSVSNTTPNIATVFTTKLPGSQTPQTSTGSISNTTPNIATVSTTKLPGTQAPQTSTGSLFNTTPNLRTVSTTKFPGTLAPQTTPSVPPVTLTPFVNIQTTKYTGIDKTDLCPLNVIFHAKQHGTVLGQYGRKCYELLTVQQSTWYQGESVCNGGRGHLVSIESPDEQKYIHQLIYSHIRNSGIWIGLNDIRVEGYMVWSSGARFTYTNIHRTMSEVLFPRGDEDCAVFLSDSGQWHSRPCLEGHHIICQFDITNNVHIIG